jgi:hypothetical protein
MSHQSFSSSTKILTEVVYLTPVVSVHSLFFQRMARDRWQEHYNENQMAYFATRVCAAPSKAEPYLGEVNSSLLRRRRHELLASEKLCGRKILNMFICCCLRRLGCCRRIPFAPCRATAPRPTTRPPAVATARARARLARVRRLNPLRFRTHLAGRGGCADEVPILYDAATSEPRTGQTGWRTRTGTGWGVRTGTGVTVAAGRAYTHESAALRLALCVYVS